MHIRKKKEKRLFDISTNILKSGKYRLVSHPNMIQTESGDVYDDISTYIDESLNIQFNLAEMFYRIFDKYLYYLLFKSFDIIYSELLLIFDDIDDSDNRAMLNLNIDHRKELLDKIRFLYFPRDFLEHLETEGYLQFRLKEKDALIQGLIREYEMNKKAKLYTEEQLKNFQNSINVILFLLGENPIRRDLTKMTEQEIRIFEDTILKKRDLAIKRNYF